MTTTSDVLTLFIPGRPPTPNVRRHWAARAKDDRLWKDTGWKLGLNAANAVGWRTPELALLTMTFVLPDNRNRDVDNLIAAQKPVVDGLVRAGVLLRDDHAHLVYAQPLIRIQRGLSGTEYAIKRLPGQERLDL